MSDAVERLVNLALYLADASQPVSAQRIRADVAGYPADQDHEAFMRMFERDKDQLRSSGFLIDTVDSDSYLLDRTRTFAASIELTPEEAAATRAAGTAMLSDPSFPFAEDLRLALAKTATGIDFEAVHAAARLADEDPAHQGALVAQLTDAAARGKRARFEYTNSYGRSGPHEIEPCGLFLHDGRWYLVGRDTTLDELRTYTISRIGALEIDSARPHTRDFERPDGFDVRTFVRLPFQYGPSDSEFIADIFIDPSAAWRAELLASGHGTLQPADGAGALTWRVHARSRQRLLRFVTENGPGVRLSAPADLVRELRAGLEEVVRAHG